ncbi:MAG TPA: deoxyguanosinetriphosphate triphosphohydrolase [Bacteroidales bacterium]|nr:MAG: hypothetical protein A2X11_08220 [Bacteroidetes bacterium GWE2_42_24]OFY31109.1 MAG: hypothetical protein A2X09_15555 [Bacteroidetes bacterium GWF2_43_11]HBZ66407.1 deoxyguanosinetriphosphate triphosphohydrolase [Bacteroidales bacterium]
MNWNQLLKEKRFRDSSVIKDISDGRNVFENDYSRIILSAHVRRLQNKAQVFPLDKSDFTRTRLTHSLEVSSFAKNLGIGVEKELIESKKLDSTFKGSIPAILQTAGLVHDIGNPPFGHFGEDTIQNYFSKYFKSGKCSEFTDEEKNDFLHFDGNVQGFRILRKLGLSDDEYGYNLTFPTLASIIKYPCSSVEGNKDDDSQISRKKFGYFQSEKVDYETINSELGLNGKRHPLVFLLEAADDVAYSVCDIEDGFRKKIISKEKLYDVIKTNLTNTENSEFIDILENLDKSIDKNHPAREELLVQKFRIKVHSYMLIEATKAFIDKHDNIMNGSFDKDLVLESKAAALRKTFKKLSITNFQHRSVLKRELVGERVISFLLEILVDATTNSQRLDNQKSKEAKLHALISPSYRFVNEILERYPNKEYNKLQLVTDYVCGMSDNFAIDLFRELMGHRVD